MKKVDDSSTKVSSTPYLLLEHDSASKIHSENHYSHIWNKEAMKSTSLLSKEHFPKNEAQQKDKLNTSIELRHVVSSYPKKSMHLDASNEIRPVEEDTSFYVLHKIGRELLENEQKARFEINESRPLETTKFISNDTHVLQEEKSVDSLDEEPSTESEASLNKKLAADLLGWQPQPTKKRNFCFDLDVEVNGTKQSSISEVKRILLLEKWKREDASYLSGIASTTSSAIVSTDDYQSQIQKEKEDSHINTIDIQNKHQNSPSIDPKLKLTKNRRAVVKQQIKEAKMFRKLFGEWVQKDWIVDESERRAWEIAEKANKRDRFQREESQLFSSKGDREEDREEVEGTFEELRILLKEAEENKKKEEIERLKMEVARKERELKREQETSLTKKHVKRNNTQMI
eukprot:MONOS_5683.1-p1 / transcript=MONOS_5683.1 / gene=MONOS_5683 / organism=Monocercomonoides_exilis_PA203 / gene_product=unspecified product / transcript_product=unspecified product / location=Mono_scaffold00168:70551-71947(-) / protein_length=400 / sequence_SO=supercontig / SO=protein_coding / is_pseudo=false